MSSASALVPAAAGAPETLEARLNRLVEEGPAAIDRRLEALDSCCTAGRAAKATAGAAIVAGTILGVTLHRGFFLLPVVGGAVFLQYLTGRRATLLSRAFHSAGLPLGREVEEEKLALRALRGDFRRLPSVHQIEDRDSLARMEGEGGIVMDDDDEPKLAPKEAIQEVLQAARA